MLPDYSLIAWLLIIFSVYLTGVSKGGFAGGFGTLSVPLMALAISPTQAAGLLLPLLLVMDAFAVKAWWGKHDSHRGRCCRRPQSFERNKNISLLSVFRCD